MSGIDGNAYRKQMSERAIHLQLHKEKYDPDIWNLEYVMCLIMPGSRLWNMGFLRTLKRAKKALEEVKSRE